MLIESISREPLQFHVLPFDAPKIRHALQVSLVDTCFTHTVCRVTIDLYSTFIMTGSSLSCSGMACVNEGSHSFTCHPHVYPHVE